MVRQARYFLHEKTGATDIAGSSPLSDTDAFALNQIQQYLSYIHVKLMEYKDIDADDPVDGSASIQTLINREKHLDAARRKNQGLKKKNESLMARIAELKTVNKGVREKNTKLREKLADMETELTACRELFRQIEAARRIKLLRNPIRKFRSIMGLAGYGERKNIG